MPKTHVARSIVINAPVQKIYSTLNDLNQWQHWSPWLVCEPEAKVVVSEDTKYYDWEGSRIGSGNLKITDEQPFRLIDYDLTFLKPWKSVAKVRFELEPADEGTKVTWIMDSSLPFFLFWMKKSMEAFLGMDFVRGLNMLKEYVEVGEVKSKLEFLGKGHYAGCQYLGIKRDCSVDEVGDKMSADFAKLTDVAGATEDNIAGEPFSIYHKWDLVKRKVSYTAGFPLRSIPDQIPSGMIKGTIPATPTYTLRHVGRYMHLGNAWTTMMMMQRSKEFKPKKGIHPFESYVNNPQEVSETELITDIHFAIK